MSARAFRLDGRIGWRVATATGIAAGRQALTLAPVPGSAVPLAAPDGSLGGAAPPRHVAVGPDGTLFIIDGAGAVLAYDACAERFAALPCLDTMPRRPGLAAPTAFAVHPRGDLLVLDGETRTITAIRLADGYPRSRFGPFVDAGGSLRAVAPVIAVHPLTGAPGAASAPAGAWDPVDIGVLPDGRILVSDRAGYALHLLDARGCPVARWTGETDEQPALSRPGVFAVAADGRIAVVEEGAPTVALLDRDGRIERRIADSDLLGDGWGDPAVAFDADGTLWLSRRIPGPLVRVARDAAGRCGGAETVRPTPADCTVLAFDRDGHAILGSGRDPCPSRAPMTAYAPIGAATIAALDSGVTGMVWDRVLLDGDVPEGTTLSIATFASDVALDDAEIAALGAHDWRETMLARADRGGTVVAIRSAPGRYLRLRLTLVGDGRTTPAVRALTVRMPRVTSARFLPATYSADPASADFLARFLALFDQLRADMLAPIDALPALFDPRATPAAEADAPGEDFLDWLAGWVGIALDRGWSVARRRRLVAEAPALFRIRGTVEGLKRHVAIYTGVSPRVVEHFRLRRWLALDETALDGTAKLWGPDIVRRLQLDEYSEIGRFALVDGSDPLTDPIAAFAHRATLYVPVGEDFGERDRAALDDVVAAAAPAHVAVDVRLMRPRFVIGCDLLLGVNTVLGHDTRVARADAAVLGEDVRLAGPPAAFTLTPGLRLGADTTLQ